MTQKNATKEEAQPPEASGRPLVSTSTATMLAIANMIGTGVFTSLGFQIAAIPSPFSLIMLWVVGGIIALCGALAYAELAAAMPRSGGEYTFLSRIYHPAIGFLAGWISVTVGFSAPIALSAMAFGSYANGILPSVQPIIWAFGVTAFVMLVHLRGVRVSGIFQDLATILKIVLIVVLLVAGFAGGGTGQVASFAPTWNDMSYMTSAPFAISLVFVMYSYWGWNAATYIASDVRDPQRSLPRSLLTATLIVLVLYTGLNAAFLYSTPMSSLSGQLNVAMIAGTYIFGEAGGKIVAALMCLGLVPAIGALVWIGPRIAAIMGEDVKLLRVFARRNGSGVPVVAMWYQAAVVTLLLVTGSFETVLEFIQFSLTLSSFLAVLGVIVLRYTQPDLPRPYRLRTLLAPGIYLGVTTFMLVHLVIERPFQSLAGLAMMAVGLIIWAVSAVQTGKEALQGGA